jgi:hypothetical protein
MRSPMPAPTCLCLGWFRRCSSHPRRYRHPLRAGARQLDCGLGAPPREAAVSERLRDSPQLSVRLDFPAGTNLASTRKIPARRQVVRLVGAAPLRPTPLTCSSLKIAGASRHWSRTHHDRQTGLSGNIETLPGAIRCACGPSNDRGASSNGYANAAGSPRPHLRSPQQRLLDDRQSRLR